MTETQQVVVFLDWQNVYRQARDAFHRETDPFTAGQVDPVDLALTLTESAPEGVQRCLKGVRIYRGMPDNAYDANGYAAARRQISQWRRDERVVVTTRKLRYPQGWQKGVDDPGLIKEKGIDVALALDFAAMATDGAYDVGILMSCDQDLLPALERVHQRRMTRGDGLPVIEVAAWKSPYRRSSRLSLGGGKPFCHWLDQQTYWGLTDSRDYTRPSPADHVPNRR